MFEMLSGLKVKKIFFCALPFSRNYTEQDNNCIHLLNTLLFNLTQRHSDKFVFFDTNKFIDNSFTLTGSSLHLPYKFKIKLATLIAYNINNNFFIDKKNIFCNQHISTSTNSNTTQMTTSKTLN